MHLCKAVIVNILNGYKTCTYTLGIEKKDIPKKDDSSLIE